MNYLIVIGILGTLILIHELGHFLAARWQGIPIARFSIGFGPKLWGWKRGKTEYWISLIPVGGYVLPALRDTSDLFQIPVRKRVLFALGGPLTNLGLPLFLFAALNTLTAGASLRGLLFEPIVQTVGSLQHILAAIPNLFTHSDEISGVVGIVSQGGQFIGGSVSRALNFSILLSLNLAIFNLLPIPVLDGGKILLYLSEKLHPRFRRLHIPFAVAGWVLMLGLMVYATAMDIMHL